MIDDEISAEAKSAYESLIRRYSSPDAIPDNLWILPKDREPNTWYLYHDTYYAGGKDQLTSDSYILKTTDKHEDKAYYFTNQVIDSGQNIVWYDGRWSPVDDMSDVRKYYSKSGFIPSFGFLNMIREEDNRPKAGRMMVKLEMMSNLPLMNWINENPLEVKQ